MPGCLTCDGTGWAIVPMPRCVWNGRLTNYVDRHGVDYRRVMTCAVTCDDCADGRREGQIESERASRERMGGGEGRRRPTFTQYCAVIGGLDGVELLRAYERDRALCARGNLKPGESFEELYPNLAAIVRGQQAEAA